MAQNVFFLYLQWHFADKPRVIFGGWKNCLRFNLNYWSLPLLVRTFFSHWRRYSLSYGRGFDLKRYFNAFTFNMVSRILGAIMRSFLIITAIFAEISIFFAGAIVLLLWLLLPLFIILGFVYGFKLLF